MLDTVPLASGTFNQLGLPLEACLTAHPPGLDPVVAWAPAKGRVSDRVATNCSMTASVAFAEQSESPTASRILTGHLLTRSVSRIGPASLTKVTGNPAARTEQALLVTGVQGNMDDNGRRITLDDPFDLAVTETLAAFRAEGFDVVSVLDVRQYLVRNIHHESRRYLLVNLLLPQVTLEALQHDPELGPVFPTTIAIYELPDGETAVVARPSLGTAMAASADRADGPVLAALAGRAGERLARALDRLRRAPVRVPGVGEL